MSVHRQPHPLDPAAVERLLGGQPVAGQDRLARFLEAVAAPAQGDELDRHQATRLAFLAARLAPVPAWKRRLSLAQARLRQIMTVKIAVLLLLSGTGGIALAAGTGSLPGPIQRYLPGGAGPSGAPSAVASRSTPPSWLLAACRRYQGRDRGQRHEALLRDADLGALVATLGGPDERRADAFCAELLRAWPDAAASGQPTADAPTRPGPHQSANGNGGNGGSGSGSGGDSNNDTSGGGNGPNRSAGTGGGGGGTGNAGPAPSGASGGRSGNRAGAPSIQPADHAASGRS